MSSLANDIAYTFTVTATTVDGTSAASVASPGVTPLSGTTGVNFIGADPASVKWAPNQVGATAPPVGATTWPEMIYNSSAYPALPAGQVYSAAQVNGDVGVFPPADLNCTNSWMWVQILCDQEPAAGAEIAARNNPNYVYKANTSAGLTVDSTTSTEAYVVIDLGSLVNFTTLRVFQMFSDGKVTLASIAAHPESGTTWPAYSDGSWQPLATSPVGTGSQYTDAASNLYTKCPTFLDFGATRSRYVRLTFMNSGEFGFPTWIEVGGAKLFFESTPPLAGSGCPPEPPTSPTAVAGNATATLSWTPGLGTASSFLLQQNRSGAGWVSAVTSPSSVPGSATSALITGLDNGVSYTFRVRAANGPDESPFSGPSNPVTPVAGLPNPPSSVSATAGNAAATVSWSSSAGATSYTVTGAPGGACTTSSTSCLITGLTNGQAYTFTVAAANGTGTSGSSDPSNEVTPTAPPPAPTSISPSSGPLTGGTAVTVTGTGFAGPVTVTVGGVAATAVVTVSATSITAVTPAGTAGAKDVVVTNLDTQVGTLTGAFTYTSGGGGGGAGGGGSPDPTPSPTTAPTPAALTLDPQTASAGLAPGQDRVTVNGQPVSVLVAANTSNTGIGIAGIAWTLTLSGRESDGTPAPLGPNGTLRLGQGRTLVTSGTGFEPNTPVRVYLMSDPVLLGALATDETGSFSGSVTVPGSTTVGRHTAQVNGYAPNGQVRSASLGVEVTSPITTRSSVGSRIYFAYQSATLSAKAKKTLRSAVLQVPAGVSSTSIVVGVVRSKGATAADRALARLRAATVASFLKTAGLAGTITVTTKPFTVHNTAQARRVNVAIAYTR